MADDAELQAKIAALEGKHARNMILQLRADSIQGRINQQRNTVNTGNQYRGYQTANARWSPYGQPAYQRPFHPKPPPPTHRNRTLVVNNGAPGPGKQPNAANAVPTPPVPGTPNAPGWISTRDRGHMQLTNTAVYGKRVQEKQKAIEETAKAKRQERDQREKTKILKHVSGTPSTITGQTQDNVARDIIINNLRFRVATDGSKLMRVFGKFGEETDTNDRCLSSVDGANNNPQSTPKQAKVAGVTFHRSKNGNLLRSGLVKKQRYRLASKPPQQETSQLIHIYHRERSNKKSTKLCQNFTSTGTKNSIKQRPDRGSRTLQRFPLIVPIGRPWEHMLTSDSGSCAQGNRCPHVHDFNKLAICKEFLRHGTCAAGEEACNLSHDPSPNRVPACTHFLRGNCTKSDCRYAHVHVNLSAAVCRDFALLGYCDKGATCTDRHVTECPDYANTGTCRNSRCRLPHIDRAGNLRKAAALKANKESDGNESPDLSSDEEDYQEIDSDDVDSDDLDEDIDMIESGDGGHELSQQQDFIAFS